MKNDPLVSIVVPVYKVERYIRTCIESVLSQTYYNWELILVDDGSPDNCPQICDEYSQRDRRVTVLHSKNGGQSRARNLALDCPPKGDFITFLDSDDFWHPDFLAIMVKMCIDNDAEMSQCSYVRGIDEAFPDLKEVSLVGVYDNHSIFLSEKSNVIMWGKLYNKALLDGIRMPVGLYNEDDWTAWKLYYKARKIVVTSQRLYYYTLNPQSTMTKMLKKPDLRYFGAYDERISFFHEKGEKDLEDASRLQFCKSLTLLYSNGLLNQTERELVKVKFSDSWDIIKHSHNIRQRYKVLFQMFAISPLITSKIVNKIRKP